MNLSQMITKLKDENKTDDIIYRTKKIGNKDLTIIFNESLVSSNTISDFVIRSLDKIDGNSVLNVYNGSFIPIVDKVITNGKTYLKVFDNPALIH